jgi:hypothetical protein
MNQIIIPVYVWRTKDAVEKVLDEVILVAHDDIQLFCDCYILIFVLYYPLFYWWI